MRVSSHAGVGDADDLEIFTALVRMIGFSGARDTPIFGPFRRGVRTERRARFVWGGGYSWFRRCRML